MITRVPVANLTDFRSFHAMKDEDTTDTIIIINVTFFNDLQEVNYIFLLLDEKKKNLCKENILLMVR